jgi:hypothetical protein
VSFRKLTKTFVAHEAAKHGLGIDAWGRLNPIHADEAPGYHNIEAPRNVNELFAFSICIANIMAGSSWVIAQINYASGLLDPYQLHFLVGECGVKFRAGDAVLIDLGPDTDNVDLPWTRFLYASIMFEHHVDFFWSQSPRGVVLSMQDGVVSLTWQGPSPPKIFDAFTKSIELQLPQAVSSEISRAQDSETPLQDQNSYSNS